GRRRRAVRPHGLTRGPCRRRGLPRLFRRRLRGRPDAQRRRRQLDELSSKSFERSAPMYLSRYDLKGQTAVVTGGAQSIGLACVEALAEAGAHVYITDRNAKTGAEAQAAMKAKGYDVGFIEMDVTHSARVEAAATHVMRERGRVDILVCNAG